MIPKIQAQRSLWQAVAAVCVTFVVLSGGGFAGTEQQADSAAISNLFRALDSPDATELPIIRQSEGGYIRFLSAPPQGRFVAPPLTGKAVPEAESAAGEFMSCHAGAFGLDIEGVELRTNRIITQENGAFVRLDQYFLGVPVFGAQVIVHVDGNLNIINVNANIMRDTGELDDREDSLVPVLTDAEAVTRAIAENAALSRLGSEAYACADNQPPERVIFVPKLFSMPGSTCLAWKVALQVENPNAPNMTALINATTGEMVLRYARQATARYREVYDADYDEAIEYATLIRGEGAAPIGNPNIDEAYNYIGDCYDWYMNEHGRDSYDNQGSKIRAYVNYPDLNAYWDTQVHVMKIGNLFLSDDVIAHEYTHGVTEVDSDLIYFSYAGAITEMYSDLGGEFIDLTNGRGNDSAEVRWWMGEDMEFKIPDTRGIEEEGEDGNQEGEGEGEDTDGEEEESLPGIRYMKDPTVLGEPDRLGSPYLWPPFSLDDLGGVHFNCGIGNKLIYLLTDGDTFNGLTVTGMGISKVADLFYAARPMLTSVADYFELYYALRAASVALNYPEEERQNIITAMKAVEIEPPDADPSSLLGLRDFRALPTYDASDNAAIVLTWKNPNIVTGTGITPLVQVTLYRSVADFPKGATDGQLLPMDSADSGYVDLDVWLGETYYYLLQAEIQYDVDPDTGLPLVYTQKLYAKARAGDPGMNVYTEVFGPDLDTGANPFDLSYTKLTFRPVLAPPPGGDDPYLAAMDFSDYEVTVTGDVYELPVRRTDEGGVYNLTSTDDDILPIPLGDKVFPFFGVPYSQLYLSSNGYIFMMDSNTQLMSDDLQNTLDTPTLAAHFALPRISLLFTDLAPHISGQVWAKDLDDRFVITLDNVAVKPGPTETLVNPDRVTAQVELFYSGHIRITYLGADVSSGIVGLSDGRGVPVEPATLFGGIRDGYHWADFSNWSTIPTRISINPIATQVVFAGDTIAFDAKVEMPPDMQGKPVFYTSWFWNGADPLGPAPFADNGNGTGSFYWETAYEDTGIYTVRIIAELGGQRVFQDVRLVVGRVFTVEPMARNVELSTNAAGEDPTADRAIPVGAQLIASYDYYHPYQNQHPLLYSPGTSLLYWFCNGQVASAFTNRLVIPPGIVRADETWWFQVTPVTIAGIKGEPVISPVVSVLGVPRVDDVYPNKGLTIGGDRITIRGSGLAYALKVTFDGVPGVNIQASGFNELSVETPVHAAGTVTVAVETVSGIGRKEDAFTYVADEDDPVEDPLSEKEKNIFGCGPRAGVPASLLYDLAPAAAVLLWLMGAGVFRRKSAK